MDYTHNESNLTAWTWDAWKWEECDYSCFSRRNLFAVVVYSIIGTAIAIVGLVFNILIFLVFRNDPKKTSTLFLMQALSVIDSYLLATAVMSLSFSTLIFYLDPSCFNFLYADLMVYVMPLTCIGHTTSVWVTILLTVHRYIAVCKTLHAARHLSLGQTHRRLVAVCASAFLYNIPLFFERRVETFTFENGTIRAIIDTELYGYWYNLIYRNILDMGLEIYLPLCILIPLNVCLIRSLIVMKRRRHKMQIIQHNRNQTQDNQVTLMLVTVVSVFIACQTPDAFFPIMMYMRIHTWYYFYNIFNLLKLINSAVNFPIYFLLNKRFASVFKSTMCKMG